jgi:hypothetical protein
VYRPATSERWLYREGMDSLLETPSGREVLAGIFEGYVNNDVDLAMLTSPC